ncbi:MAG: hypothetical protein V8R96_00395 [Gemmiger sp.]
MIKMNNTLTSKQADILLLQHNNPCAIVLERQIFAEAIEQGILCCASETNFTRMKTLLSRRKIQKYIGKVLQSQILANTVLENYLKDCAAENRKPIVLFLNTFFTEVRYPPDALKYLKRRYDAFFALYYIDAADRGVSTYANYLREQSVFDAVFTFDKADANKYHIRFWQTPYSARNEKSESKIDLYFCGVDTDRTAIINAISKIEKLDFSMDLIQIENNNQYNDERISTHTVDEIMPYEVVLKRTLEANCVLEIVRPGQVGFTLRTFEAVVYNKKLLTNNEHIKEFQFYNPSYMKVFKSVEDIDWKWVKERNAVNYHYKGDFSPIRLIEEINRIRCQMEKSQ